MTPQKMFIKLVYNHKKNNLYLFAYLRTKIHIFIKNLEVTTNNKNIQKLDHFII